MEVCCIISPTWTHSYESQVRLSPLIPRPSRPPFRGTVPQHRGRGFGFERTGRTLLAPADCSLGGSLCSPPRSQRLNSGPLGGPPQEEE